MIILGSHFLFFSFEKEFIDQRLEAGRPEEHFTIQMYQMDIERNRFLICNFAKIRIMKIQKQKEYIIGDPELIDRLSDAEKVFLTSLNTIDERHMTETFVNRLNNEAHVDLFSKNVSALTFSHPKFDVSTFLPSHSFYLDGLS